MAATKRPQNKCKSCGNTWYPRGKNISSKCPNCGSNEVSVVWSWGGAAALIFVAWAIFGGNDKPKEPLLTKPAEVISVHSSDAVEVSEPARSTLPPNTSEHPSATDVRNRNGAHLRVETSAVQAQKEQVTTSAATPTPSSICANEGNVFSRNNCEWRECEKPEFTELPACMHKKHKDDPYGG